MVEIRELGATGLLGRRAKAKFGTQRLEVEISDPSAMSLMGTGRPTANPHHRWWAEGELKNWQDAAAKGQKMADS